MGEPQIPEDIPRQPEKLSPITPDDMKRWQALQGVQELGINLSGKQLAEKTALEDKRQQELAKIRDSKIIAASETDIGTSCTRFFQLRNMEPLSQGEIETISRDEWQRILKQFEANSNLKGKGDVDKIRKLREKGQLSQKEQEELGRLVEAAINEKMRLLGFANYGILPILVAPPQNRKEIIEKYTKLTRDKNTMRRIKELEAVEKPVSIGEEKKTQAPTGRNIEDVTYEDLRNILLPKVFQKTRDTIIRRVSDWRLQYPPNRFIDYLNELVKQIKPNYTDWEGLAIITEETMENLRRLYYGPEYILRPGTIQEIVRTINSKEKAKVEPIPEQELSQEEVNRTNESLVNNIKEAKALIDERVRDIDYTYLPKQLLSVLEKLTDGINQGNYQDRKVNIEGMLGLIRELYIADK